MEASESQSAAEPSRRRRLVAAVGVIALIAAATILFRHWRGQSAENEIVVYGNIDVREVDVAFNEGDRIVAMHAEEGDSVETGQLLAELDRSRLEHAMLAAEAQVAAQRAVVARFEHGSRPEEIERARAELAAAKADLADARATHERARQLLAADAASPQQADDAKAAYLSAQARLRAAQENLRLAIEGPRDEDTEAARAKLRADENALELAKHRLADTKLYAPAAGTVLTRILEPGAVVLPNTPAYTLALKDPVWVRAYFPETDLGRVYPGMRAEITTDSFPDRHYAGWVGFISPTAEFTPKPVETPELRTSLVYRTRIYVRNPDRTLRQGMPVTVHLPLDQAPRPAEGNEGNKALEAPSPAANAPSDDVTSTGPEAPTPGSDQRTAEE